MTWAPTSLDSPWGPLLQFVRTSISGVAIHTVEMRLKRCAAVAHSSPASIVLQGRQQQIPVA